VASLEGWADRPDAELVRAVRQSRRPADREAAFEAIYNRHSGAVLALCGGLLADFVSAQDAAAETFAVAYARLTRGKPLAEPAKLGGWLINTARNRCREEWRRRDRQGPMPEYETDDEAAAYETASRARRAQVERLVSAVAATLTDQQRLVHELSYGERLRGAQLAQRLGVKPAQATRLAQESRVRVALGFGALVLARGGRPYCQTLAGILDRAAWDGEHFTMALRQRIVRHFDSCKTCDDCRVCAAQHQRQVGWYAPALVPLLASPGLYDRVMSMIQEQQDGDDADDDDDDDDDKDDKEDRDEDDRDRGRRVVAWPRPAVVLAAASLALGGSLAAAIFWLVPHARTAPVRIVAISAVAAITDVPGKPGCPPNQGFTTNCTTALRLPKGKPNPVNVVVRGGGIALRYFGCDDRAPAGAPGCVVTPAGSRTLCITTSDPRDAGNRAECRRRTA
jgi:RNA polymerase sigma factor (sigma-70 family)